MVAVLEDAIKCFQKYALEHDHWEKRLLREVGDWILKKNSEWLYSFDNIRTRVAPIAARLSKTGQILMR
jgi:hypothetical protein